MIPLDYRFCPEYESCLIEKDNFRCLNYEGCIVYDRARTLNSHARKDTGLIRFLSKQAKALQKGYLWQYHSLDC